MNFNPVGRDSNGEMFVKLHQPFSIVERIQLLQRWILVQSFAYYELNENIASDFQYDANARQLVELMREYPDEAARSKYHLYFHDYCPATEDAHFTSGFDLIERLRKKDEKGMYRNVWRDAAWALELKSRRNA